MRSVPHTYTMVLLPSSCDLAIFTVLLEAFHVPGQLVLTSLEGNVCVPLLTGAASICIHPSLKGRNILIKPAADRKVIVTAIYRFMLLSTNACHAPVNQQEHTINTPPDK
jgi:hypothetical protein